VTLHVFAGKAKRHKGPKTTYVQALERKVERLQERGLSDCGGDFFAGEQGERDRLLQRGIYMDDEPETPREELLAPSKPEEERVPYPETTCKTCGETFKREGNGQARRTYCYGCRPRDQRKERVIVDPSHGFEFARLRKAAGMTQPDAARLFGVSLGTVYRWETGRGPLRPAALEWARGLRAEEDEDEGPEADEGLGADEGLEAALREVATAACRAASLWLKQLAERIAR